MANGPSTHSMGLAKFYQNFVSLAVTFFGRYLHLTVLTLSHCGVSVFCKAKEVSEVAICLFVLILRWPNTVLYCTGVRRRYLKTMYFWAPKIDMV